jgi:ataxia telangiectasia mutated family protein
VSSRIIHVQIMTFFIYRYHDQLHLEAQADIRRALLDLLDEEDANLQSWALVASSHLAASMYTTRPTLSTLADVVLDSPPHSSGHIAPEQSQWDRVWAHATRKIAISNISRAACHTTTSLLNCGLASTSRHTDDVRGVLSNIEVQGPPLPYDSVCAFLSAAISIARNDASLYQLGLEDRIIVWLSKWSIVDHLKTRARMEQYSAADVYQLLCELASLSAMPIADIETQEMLPDCAIVDRLIEEQETRALRRLILLAEYPVRPNTKSGAVKSSSGNATQEAMIAPPQASLGGVDTRSGRIVALLTKSLDSLSQEWLAGNETSVHTPERVRKILDLIVIAVAFTSTLKASGVHTDDTCVQSIIHLMTKIKPSLVSSTHSTPGQHLMWSAFRPFADMTSQKPPTWPILLGASSESSGIRKALLRDQETMTDGDAAAISQLQKLVWSDPMASLYYHQTDLMLMSIARSCIPGYCPSDGERTEGHNVYELNAHELVSAPSGSGGRFWRHQDCRLRNDASLARSCRVS